VIQDEIKKLIDAGIKELLGQTAHDHGVEIFIERPDNRDFGDYATSVAFLLAKIEKRSPNEIAQELAAKLSGLKLDFISKVEAIGGYVNFFLSKKYLQDELAKIADDKNFGFGQHLKGKTVMVEYTDPNPFKLFHIGHLMSNAIGEAIARLYEASGAEVKRANYQGDVGLHVAKAIWGMKRLSDESNKKKMPEEGESLSKKMEFLGEAYTFGSLAYENQPETKEAIAEINEKVYSKSDEEINRLYDTGKNWSLEYFETIYQRLDTKFDNYFFESEMGNDGLALLAKNPKVFQKSNGAVIFKGEDYGLHTRVFVNSQGLPTYEAKELGLNKRKFELYPLDLSVIVTGNEIVEYFRVLHKVMELVIPEVAAKTLHIPHGMMRLASGKMSSRTGDVVTAEQLIEETKSRIREKENKENGLTEKEHEHNSEGIAIGAIKYSILKQSPGHDIVFDFDKSLAVEGDSGPYLQYAYARLKGILNKAGGHDLKKGDFGVLQEDRELDLVRHLLEFPPVIKDSGEKTSPQYLAGYLYELAGLANRFYESLPVMKEPDENIKTARLGLVEIVASVLKTGLNLLGMQVLERI
jgi:arginyl-tRNA synthetase